MGERKGWAEEDGKAKAVYGMKDKDKCIEEATAGIGRIVMNTLCLNILKPYFILSKTLIVIL